MPGLTRDQYKIELVSIIKDPTIFRSELFLDLLNSPGDHSEWKDRSICFLNTEFNDKIATIEFYNYCKETDFTLEEIEKLLTIA